MKVVIRSETDADAVGCKLIIEFITQPMKRRAAAQPKVHAVAPKAARRST